MKRLAAICAAVILFTASSAVAGTWTTIDVPGATQTLATSISRGNIVGYYMDNMGFEHGFLYNGTTWTSLDKPGANRTYVTHIDGTNIVGYYTNPTSGVYHGFLYDGETWTTLDRPGAHETCIRGISGSNLVGTADYDGFLYNGTTWTTISTNTQINGVDGNKMVGYYYGFYGGYSNPGFFYDGTSGSILNIPGVDGMTYLSDIDGSNIVGRSGIHSFLYNGTTWTSLDMLGAKSTVIKGIEGDFLVGFYADASYISHGFVYEIPEPTTLLLLGLGALMLRKKI